MDFSGFVGILKESSKILAKNGKVMGIIATISILLNSLLLFTSIFCTTTVIRDLLSKVTLLLLTDPGSPGFADLLLGFKEDLQIMLGVESTIFLTSFVLSLYFMGTTILVSATTYSGDGKFSSFKNLMSRLAGSFKRTFATSFYIALFLIGYIFLVLAILMHVRVFVDRPFSLKSISIALGIVALTFWIYLSVVWVLALVISVIEESCYGIEALGKAGGLVKGKRLHGFALNLLVVLVSMIVFQGSRMIKVQNSIPTQIIVGFLSTVFFCLVAMFQYVTFTVLYFQCKKTHDEEIELQGSREYTKVPFIPLDTEDMP